MASSTFILAVPRDEAPSKIRSPPLALRLDARQKLRAASPPDREKFGRFRRILLTRLIEIAFLSPVAVNESVSGASPTITGAEVSRVKGKPCRRPGKSRFPGNSTRLRTRRSRARTPFTMYIYTYIHIYMRVMYVMYTTRTLCSCVCCDLRSTITTLASLFRSNVRAL